MSSSLIKLEKIVASSSSSITLTLPTNYDVFMVKIAGVKHSEAAYDYVKFRTSGSTIVSSDYYQMSFIFRSNGAFFNSAQAGASFAYLNQYQKSTATGDQTNATIWIYNSQNSGEKTYATFEETSQGTSLIGAQGGMAMKLENVVDGINFSPSAGNYPTGRFVLYGLKK